MGRCVNPLCVAAAAPRLTECGDAPGREATRDAWAPRLTRKPKAMTFRTHSRENTMVKAMFRYFSASS